MREFSFRLDKELTLGLRPDRRVQTNAFYLRSCQGARPKPWGLCGAEGITKVADEVVSWPFPQMHQGKARTLMFYEDRISEISACGAENILIDNLPIGLQWSIADAYATVLATNGECAVILEPDRVDVYRNPRISCCTYFAGRIVIGGFCYDDTLPVWNQLDANSVWYSTVGAGDIRLLFNGISVISQRKVVLQNESGYLPLPSEGTVVAMKQLGQNLMCYSTDGVYSLTPFYDPVHSFGVHQVNRLGIAGRCAVNGSDARHLMIDKLGSLFLIDREANAKRLGHEEFLTNEVCGELAVSYDEEREEFYIANNTLCLVLTESGLGSHWQRPTSLARVNGELVGPTVDGSSLATIKTDLFNMNMRQIKMIRSLEFQLRNISDMEVRIGAMYERRNEEDEASIIHYTDWLPLNIQGLCFPMISGIDFTLEMRATMQPNSEIASILARWTLEDKSQVRSYYSAAGSATS